MQDALDHYDAIRSALLSAEAAHPGSPELNALHGRLGEAWDAYRAAHGGTAPEFSARSGGGDKPPQDPNEPEPGGG